MMLERRKFDLQLFADPAPGTDPGKGQDTGKGQEGDNAGAQTGGAPETNNQPGKTFTQEELERIIAERLERERKKYADYNDLKKAAEELKKIKESQMSEQEKLQAKLAEMERALLEKEREAAEARTEALKLKVLDEMGLPKAWAARIFGTTEEEIRADAKELQKLLGAQGKTVGGGTNPANPGNGATPTFTREQIKRMTPEEINANWDAIMKQMANGGIK